MIRFDVVLALKVVGERALAGGFERTEGAGERLLPRVYHDVPRQRPPVVEVTPTELACVDGGPQPRLPATRRAPSRRTAGARSSCWRCVGQYRFLRTENAIQTHASSRRRSEQKALCKELICVFD